MEVNNVRKYIGKKVLVILRNNFQYTIIIPNFSGSSFSVRDKFNANVEISCEFIDFIKELEQ
jgi:hypothetical protein